MGSFQDDASVLLFISESIFMGIHSPGFTVHDRLRAGRFLILGTTGGIVNEEDRYI
jgi:hypothetical protein